MYIYYNWMRALNFISHHSHLSNSRGAIHKVLCVGLPSSHSFQQPPMCMGSSRIKTGIAGWYIVGIAKPLGKWEYSPCSCGNNPYSWVFGMFLAKPLFSNIKERNNREYQPMVLAHGIIYHGYQPINSHEWMTVSNFSGRRLLRLLLGKLQIHLVATFLTMPHEIQALDPAGIILLGEDWISWVSWFFKGGVMTKW